MRLIDCFFRALEWVLVFLLAGMTLMVFANVVLRYGFGSGIDVSEELSRFFFVWLIFLGAIVAMRRNMHMGFDLVVATVSPPVRRVLLTLANGAVMGVCVLILLGTIQQFHVNATNIAPVTRMPMIWVFGVLIPMSLLVGLMAGLRMLGYATGRLTEAPGQPTVADSEIEVHK
ncbi:TRAP transporter small permease [Alloyangia pacifica]|uniref:TRAP transporter small permease protein n=1 Tax=Alloyangia pacifica TaxID=311180 RepID=A0A1I6WGQ8_9RHOB|nr:TRAP transporter small permease [Alloyangia pacifica]SDI74203.1 TRAP-type C4-dicarboxylate transport system, small permease component [Alloyangia pacifica]SFT25167.1 TRAP-type C4-dicarboxylate transport system, small permease component [Alloyangia pacifica]